MMSNNKGVTLVSLSMYIVVSIIVLASFTFLNINFMSQIADLSTESEMTNEVLKAQSYLINDLKSANGILEFSNKHLRLDNGVEYSIKYRANEKEEPTSQTYYVYELYRNDILITDKMANLSFDYNYRYDEEKQRTVSEWIIVNIMDNEMFGGNMYVKVGKGY